MPYPNPCNIRFTHPALDCVHCRVRNFEDSDEKYAECCNKKKTCGCDAISIETKNSSYEWTVTCHGCSDYESKNQLKLDLITN